jgi:hypothetical protein
MPERSDGVTTDLTKRSALFAVKRDEPKSAYFERVPAALNSALVTVTERGGLWLHAPHALFTPEQGRALIESLELAITIAEGGTR